MSRRAILLLLAALALSCVEASAQGDKHESQLRTVRGQVLDKQESPLATARVYLRNLRTQTVKTYISDDAGNYRFSGLDPNVDYELHAERDELTSAKRRVSSFDTRKEIVLNLKLDKKKEGKEGS